MLGSVTMWITFSMVTILPLCWLGMKLWWWFTNVNFTSKTFKGKIILITGGASGLGKELALSFHKYGATVVVWDIHENKLQSLMKRIESDSRLYTYVCDVSDRLLVYEIAKQVMEEVGPVDILINNAGVVSGDTIINEPDELVEKTIQVNCISHFWTAKAFLPKMLERDTGHIVTISSVMGTTGGAYLGSYCVSKFGSFAFAECLRLELSLLSCNIQTTVVLPYHITTNMFEGISHNPIVHFFLPSLHPRDVTREIITAVVKKKQVVILPSIFWFIYVARGFAPVRVFDICLRLTGVLHAMKDFTKKKKQ